MGLFHPEKYYLKEGAGIYRNVPQKKSAPRRFFGIFGRKFTALLRANLLYILLSLPLVTGGLAEAGLTYITRNAAREKYAFPCADFFATIRRNWKQALLAGIIRLVVNAIFILNIYFYGSAVLSPTEGAENAVFLSGVLLVVNLLGMLLFSFMNYYVFMLIVTFSLKLKQIYKNAFLFAIANLYQNLLIFICKLGAGAVLFAPALFLDYRLWLIFLLAVYVLIYPAFCSLLTQFTIFPFIKRNMIDPYYAEHPEADKKAMRALNLDEGEEDSSAIFTDRVPDKPQTDASRKEKDKQD